MICLHIPSSCNPATTPTTRPHAATRPPPTPPRVVTAHPCLGPAWTMRVRSMAAFMATQTEHSPKQARRAPRRHPAQPVTMRAESGGSTPTRGSDLAYGTPRPPHASAGASGVGRGALVPGNVFSFSAHRRQSLGLMSHDERTTPSCSIAFFVKLYVLGRSSYRRARVHELGVPGYNTDRRATERPGLLPPSTTA
jgi:hypothetical protein